MAFVRYDEPTLIKVLERLPRRLRVAFAALCAQRLLPGYLRWCGQTGRGDAPELASIMNRLWQDLEGNEMSAEDVQERLNTCMGLIPKEDEEPSVKEDAHAEDAVVATAYALRTRQNGEPQEAAWAAARAYETLDYHLTYREGSHTTDVSEVERTMAHPLVQAELLRQQRDLEDLLKIIEPHDGAPLLAKLRVRAQADAVRFFGEVDA